MSDRRNKREKEQLFNMPEIAKLEKKSFSGAIEKLEDSKLKKSFDLGIRDRSYTDLCSADLHDAISVCDDAGELHGAYSGSWKPVFCKQACL